MWAPHRHYEYDSLSSRALRHYESVRKMCSTIMLLGLSDRPPCSVHRDTRKAVATWRKLLSVPASKRALLTSGWCICSTAGLWNTMARKKERCAKGGTSSCPRAMQIHVKFRCARILSNGEHMSVQWCRCGRLSQAMLQYL